VNREALVADLDRYNKSWLDDPRRWWFWSAAVTLGVGTMVLLWHHDWAVASVVGFTTSLVGCYPTFMRIEALNGFSHGWQARDRFDE
jgi:hypothetical protein